MTANIQLHFAHANGFPAPSYRTLFNALPDHFEVLALDKFAHNPAFPVSKEWALQVEELMDYVSSQTDQAVYLVGHSFGAVISYMAACKYPQKCRGLIMLDPPLVTGITRQFIKLIKHTPWFDKMTPAGKAATRCTQWPADTDLVAYFASKGLFKNMHLQCIEDYVSSAISANKAGYQLAFDHQVEADLFRTVPLNLPRYFGKLSVPAVLLTGQHTEVCIPKMIDPFIRHNGLQHDVFPNGGHMFPLEYPVEVAERITQYIQGWNK